MLLYQYRDGSYLAVPKHLRFAGGAGFQLCFDGQDVPDIICAAFIRESGGRMLEADHQFEVLSSELEMRPRRAMAA